MKTNTLTSCIFRISGVRSNDEASGEAYSGLGTTKVNLQKVKHSRTSARMQLKLIDDHGMLLPGEANEISSSLIVGWMNTGS